MPNLFLSSLRTQCKLVHEWQIKLILTFTVLRVITLIYLKIQIYFVFLVNNAPFEKIFFQFYYNLTQAWQVRKLKILVTFNCDFGLWQLKNPSMNYIYRVYKMLFCNIHLYSQLYSRLEEFSVSLDMSACRMISALINTQYWEEVKTHHVVYAVRDEIVKKKTSLTRKCDIDPLTTKISVYCPLTGMWLGIVLPVLWIPCFCVFHYHWELLGVCMINGRNHQSQQN